MWVFALVSCVQPAPPGEAWELLLHGQVVGIVRSWQTGSRVRRERLLRVEADGVTHEQRTVVTLDLGLDGALTHWRIDRGDERREGSLRAFDAWSALPPTGSVPLLDERLGAVVQREVTRTADHLGWDTPGGPVAVTLQNGRPVAGTWAGTSFRAASPTLGDPPPLDVAAVLARPAPAFPRARRSNVAEWSVGGTPVRVDTPLLDELPPWTAAIGDLARRVADEVVDAAAPFGSDGDAGDCTEHADRFLELATASGFEVRPAAGWLYLPEPEPRLWLHAWAEVRVGDTWVGVDPTLGQFPADAGHLRIGGSTVDIARADLVDVTLRDLR